jgi:RimJ/RimL family protein N-acetyltransferase
VSPLENDSGQSIGDPVPGWRPRPRPEPGPFHGRHCAVVPLRPEHAAELYPTCAAPGTESLWTYLADGPYPDLTEFAARIERTVDDPGNETVAVLGPDGVAGGIASYLRIDPGNGSVEVGGILLGTSLQRTTAATEAMYLMARHVFDDLGYRRYEWKCDALNASSRAAAERLGFVFEGVHRNAVVYKGRNRDTAWFSVTDAEWPAIAAGLRGWLDEGNFDAEGRQRKRLQQLRGGSGLPDAGTAVPHRGTRERMA